MRVKWNILLLLLFIFIILCFNNKFYASGSNKTVFEEIVTKTGSCIVEYGITTSFQTSKNGTEACNQILNNMNFGKDTKITRFAVDSVYRLEFQNKTASGYVESVVDEGKSIIKLHIIISDNSDHLQNLKDKVKEALGSYCSNPKLFMYLKARVPYYSTENTNRSIVSLLADSGTINIDTVNLRNGYSTVCYTGRLEPTTINGKLIDLNFAVCSYTSGNYIILGTPEILETY